MPKFEPKAPSQGDAPIGNKDYPTIVFGEAPVRPPKVRLKKTPHRRDDWADALRPGQYWVHHGRTATGRAIAPPEIQRLPSPGPGIHNASYRQAEGRTHRDSRPWHATYGTAIHNIIGDAHLPLREISYPALERRALAWWRDGSTAYQSQPRKAFYVEPLYTEPLKLLPYIKDDPEAYEIKPLMAHIVREWLKKPEAERRRRYYPTMWELLLEAE